MEGAKSKRGHSSTTTAEAGNTRQRGQDGKATKPAAELNDIGEEYLEFEDPFGDEFEEEQLEEDDEQAFEDEDEEEEDEEAEGVEGVDTEKKSAKQQQKAAKEASAAAADDENHAPKQVWRPGVDHIAEGEALEYDPSAYVMYHSLQTEWPCLSFDILKDDLGESRQRFPLTMFAVSGSQADRADRNKVTLLKLSELQKTQTAVDSDGESDDDENVDEDPTIEHVNAPHQGCVNRIRSMPQSPGIIATMADTGHAHIYDFSESIRSMMAKGPRAVAPSKPAFTFRGHKTEGYALDWCKSTGGRLASGDCAGAIHIWNSTGSGAGTNWQVDANAYTGHKGSVEDLQWSPSEGTVFSSCSSDKTVRIWDTRGRTGPQITIDAHLEDVNVISWNSSVAYLLASGSDDGSFKVWDLRAIRDNKSPLANFKYHKGPITSIEWAPHDESVICLSSADNQVTVWDLSVEADDEPTAAAAAALDPTLADFPAQLLFIHQGQSNVKEVHFHPQIPGVIMTTAEDGFNIFKPAISVSSS